MKKTLVALAAMASMSAFAQSSVTLFGLADVYFGSVKSETGVPLGGTSQTVLNSGGQNGSRWGMRGTEDLGGGLKANFVLESGYDISTGAAGQGGLLFGRQAFVGFSGGFGEVRLGRQYTAYDELIGATTNVFDSNIFSPVDNVWGLGLDYTSRANNQIYYATPDFGGVSGAVGYALGENKTATTRATSILSFHVKYANGPLLVGLAHQNEKFAVGSTKYTLVAGSYDLGVVKLTGGFNNAKVSGGTKQKEFQFGVTVPVGAVAISAGLATHKQGNVKGNGFGLAAEYALSKRTTAYAGLETDKAKSSGTTVAKNRIAAVGVRHRF